MSEENNKKLHENLQICAWRFEEKLPTEPNVISGMYEHFDNGEVEALVREVGTFKTALIPTLQLKGNWIEVKCYFW